MLDQAITSGSQIVVSVGELFGIAGGIAGVLVAVVGVYMAGVKRDDAADRKIEDIERWLDEEWKGGPRRKGGHLQTLESLRYDQIHGRGATAYRREATGEHPHASKHKTMGPGHDTQA